MHTEIKLPPIGVMPERLWVEKRLYELSEAIYRYTNGGYKLPQEWVEEYNKLWEELSK